MDAESCGEENNILVVFDFDHTIFDGNSDIYIQKLYPAGIPDHIESLYSDRGWTDYMGAIFRLFYENKITIEEIRGKLLEIPFTSGMESLLKYLRSNKPRYEVIIISDANVLFITWMLEACGMTDSVDVVYSNPAFVNDEGCLHIKYFHYQDWCDLSSRNMCKGHIMEDHIKRRSESGKKFDKVVYVGDGSNDFCPALRLGECDVVFPREGYSLNKKIIEQTTPLKARVKPWKCASEIQSALQSFRSDSGLSGGRFK